MNSKNSITANTPLHNHCPPVRRRVYQPHGSEPSATKQEFKDDCDINNILRKYQRTGALNHFAKYAGTYGDFSPRDLQESYDLLKRAQAMFDELPSSIRKEVATPEGFLSFVQNPDNKKRMAELGLVKAPTPPIVAPEATSTTPPVGGAGGAGHLAQPPPAR
ncbi:MAG: internal scaffolding protein [Microviridae sp.]|nr:MAG: internal scaffolding protein [Microviridae sp.]